MGCGSSLNQMDNVSPPKEIKQNHELDNHKDIVYAP